MLTDVTSCYDKLKLALAEERLDDANGHLIELDQAIRCLFNSEQVTKLSQESVNFLTEISAYFYKASSELSQDAKAIQASLLKMKQADKVKKAYQL